MDWLVAKSDSLAGIRLKQSGLTDEERLCLQRVRAIITYGANRHYQAKEQMVEQSLQRCLKLKNEHLRAIRSRNWLWGLLWELTVSRTRTDPRRAFRDILKDSPNIRQKACKKFNNCPRWWIMPLEQPDSPGHLSRVLHPAVLQLAPLIYAPINHNHRTVQ